MKIFENYLLKKKLFNYIAKFYKFNYCFFLTITILLINCIKKLNCYNKLLFFNF